MANEKVLFDDALDIPHTEQKANFFKAVEGMGIQSLREHVADDYMTIGYTARVAHDGNPIAHLYVAEDDILSNGTMKISRNGNDPFLKAHMEDEDRGLAKTVLIVPKEWAREAYETNRFCKETIDYAMTDDDEEVMDFIRENRLCQDIEKDPVTFGIVRAAMGVHDEFDDAANKELARALSAFQMENFAKQFSGESIPPGTADRDAYAVERKVYDTAFEYFENMHDLPKKRDAVANGIEKFLEDRTLESSLRALGGYLRGEKVQKRNLQLMGKEKPLAR